MKRGKFLTFIGQIFYSPPHFGNVIFQIHCGLLTLNLFYSSELVPLRAWGRPAWLILELFAMDS